MTPAAPAPSPSDIQLQLQLSTAPTPAASAVEAGSAAKRSERKDSRKRLLRDLKKVQAEIAKHRAILDRLGASHLAPPELSTTRPALDQLISSETSATAINGSKIDLQPSHPSKDRQSNAEATSRTSPASQESENVQDDQQEMLAE